MSKGRSKSTYYKYNTETKQPLAGIPACPSCLSKEAKKEWNRITALLEQLGTISKVDANALVIYCNAWTRYIQAEEAISKQGLTCISPQGIKENPHIKISKDCQATITKYLLYFGITPYGRLKLNLEQATEAKDDFTDFINEGADAARI